MNWKVKLGNVPEVAQPEKGAVRIEPRLGPKSHALPITPR